MCIDSDGMSKRNRDEAMWALHSHGSQNQWIRLIWAHEGGLAEQPSLTGGDGLELCRAHVNPKTPGDEGRKGGRGEIRAAQSQDQQHVDKRLSQSVCWFRS